MTRAAGTDDRVGNDPEISWRIILIILVLIFSVPEAVRANGGQLVVMGLAYGMSALLVGAVISCLIRQGLVMLVSKEPGPLRIKKLFAYMILEIVAMIIAFGTSFHLYYRWLCDFLRDSYLHYWLIEGFGGRLVHSTVNIVRPEETPVFWLTLVLLYEILCFVPNLFFVSLPGEDWRRVLNKFNILGALGFGLILPILLAFLLMCLVVGRGG